MANEHLKAAFSLGIKLADCHGIERTGDADSNDAIFEALQSVVRTISLCWEPRCNSKASHSTRSTSSEDPQKNSMK